MILMSAEFEPEEDTELSDAELSDPDKKVMSSGRALQEGAEGLGERRRKSGDAGEKGGKGGKGGIVIDKKEVRVGKDEKGVKNEGMTKKEGILKNEGIAGIDESLSPTKGRFTETYPIEEYPIKFQHLVKNSRSNSFDPFSRLLLRLKEKLKQVEDYDCNVLGDGNASVLTLGDYSYCDVLCISMIFLSYFLFFPFRLAFLPFSFPSPSPRRCPYAPYLPTVFSIP